MTKEEVQVEYNKVAAEFGDLQFVRESLLAQLKGVDEKLGGLRKRREELGAAYQQAAQTAPSADGEAHAVATPAGE